MNVLLPALLLLAPAGPQAEKPVSFVHDVLPVLTRQGCNAAACHGSPSGKGGFRLSLAAMTRAGSIHPAAPGPGPATSLPIGPRRVCCCSSHWPRSPTRAARNCGPAIPLIVSSYAGSSRAAGPISTPPPVCIDVSPAHGTLVWPEKELRLRHRAHYADGTSRDITHLADYLSADEAVATVGSSGLVTAHERGETSIVVRYGEQAVVCRFTLLRDVPGFVWPRTPENNPIDTLVFERLKRLCIPPSPLCTDSEFMRGFTSTSSAFCRPLRKSRRSRPTAMRTNGSG